MNITEGLSGHINQEPSTREIVRGTYFSERGRALLREPRLGKLSLLGQDGNILPPTEMWYELQDDGTLLMNTTKFRRKYHHMQQNSSAGFLVSRENYQYVSLSGTVVLVDDPQTGQRDIRRLAERYLGKEAADSIMEEEFSREERVSIILSPTRIIEYFSQ